MRSLCGWFTGLVTLAVLCVGTTSADDLLGRESAEEDVDQDIVAEPEIPPPDHYAVQIFDSAVFVGRRLGSIEAVQRDLDLYLKQKIVAIDLACRLNDVQKRRLQLAGTIDLARLFKEFGERRRQFESIENPGDVIRREIMAQADIAQRSLYSDPFGDGSFFAKVLQKALTAGQLARCEALLTRTARVNGVTFHENAAGKSEVQEVRFPGTDFGDDEATRLREMRSLQSLALDFTAVTDAGMAHFRELANLEELNLEGTQIGDRGLAHLNGLRSLKRLFLGATHITDHGLMHLRQLSNLKELDLHNTRTGGPGLGVLEELGSLRILDLASTRTRDRDLSHFCRCVGLERLSLRNTSITDAGLTHLNPLMNLRELNLGDTQVTDAGIAELVVLSKLSVLDLRGTKVTDKGIVLLRELPKLRHLYLFDTDVSEEAITGLQRPGREVRAWR